MLTRPVPNLLHKNKSSNKPFFFGIKKMYTYYFEKLLLYFYPFLMKKNLNYLLKVKLQNCMRLIIEFLAK